MVPSVMYSVAEMRTGASGESLLPRHFLSPESRLVHGRALITLAPVNRRRQKKLTRRLVLAALLGDTATVACVLRTGVDPRLPNARGTLPLYAASVHGDAEAVRLLLRAGALPDAESGHGSEGTPLCGAACWGHVDAVRELLAHGADPNLPEDRGTGWTPLRWARGGPHPQTEAVLVAAGAIA
jgi:ankyrin repeat protein